MLDHPGTSGLLWNPGQLPRPTRDAARLKHEIEVFGYCIVERALEGKTLEAIRARLLEQADAERKLHNKKNPANVDPLNQWVGMLLNKGDVFFELIRHPLLHVAHRTPHRSRLPNFMHRRPDSAPRRRRNAAAHRPMVDAESA